MAAHVIESTISDWQQKLDPLGIWISVKRDDNGTTLTCKLCTLYENRLKHARNFSRNFIVGIYGTTLKKDNVVKHKRSEQHLTAERIHNKPQNLLEIYSLTKIGQAVTKAESGERQRVGRLVDIAYMIAKTGSSFKKYSPIIDIEKKHKVDLGQTYHNDMACREFISCIHEVMENDLKSELVNANYISLLTDGSTDSGIVEKELMYLIFLDKSGTLQTVFFGIKNVVDGTARGLKELIDKAFCDFGLVNYKQRLIGLGADGASVDMGAKNGLAALLRSDGMPWLVAVHCFNHRLELAMKDALGKTYMAEIDRVLMLLYYQYHNSPKKLREFRELGNIMQISATKPKKSHGTRWVQHKVDAINALIKDYEAIVSHLETQIVALPNKNTSKEFGILKKLKQFQFVIHLLFFSEILKPVARLSVTWQKDSISMPQVLVALKNLKITLDQMSSSIVSDSSVTVCDHLHRDSSALLNETENDDKDISFKNIQLQNIATGKKHFLSNRSSYIEQIQKACENRMKIDDTVLGCSQILDTRLWPADELQLGQFGNDKIVMLLNHFKEILSTPEPDSDTDQEGSLNPTISSDVVMAQWQELKLFISANMSNLTPSLVWARIHQYYQTDFGEVSRLINILRVLPFSNACVERCFSTMGKVKTDWRAALSENSLEQLIRIKKCGPSVHDYADTERAVNVFFARKPRRPSTEPYGVKSTSKCHNEQIAVESLEPESNEHINKKQKTFD